ncbi:MAG: DUF721 domain-containing protein [Paracoccaceae bacterium]|nr:DUF721 domain-containing protein [Paracoccaceae bacterium]
MSEDGHTRTPRRGKGFRRTATLVQAPIKGVGAKRGFAVARVLTHWAEIVGRDIAAAAKPVDVSFGREGLGATLTLLVKGAEAPLLEMQKERIRETVNACYGYNAIARIRFTQTAASGFDEEAASYEAAPRPAPEPRAAAAAEAAVRPIEDPGLRAALEALGARVLSQSKQQQRSER